MYELVLRPRSHTSYINNIQLFFFQIYRYTAKLQFSLIKESARSIAESVICTRFALGALPASHSMYIVRLNQKCKPTTADKQKPNTAKTMRTGWIVCVFVCVFIGQTNRCYHLSGLWFGALRKHSHFESGKWKCAVCAFCFIRSFRWMVGWTHQHPGQFVSFLLRS